MKTPSFEIPENLRSDTLAYAGHVRKFLSGGMKEAMFKAIRVPMGVYEQRQSGRYMVRIRIPAGRLDARQAVRIAEMSRTFGSGVIHLTTRQDMQIHDVSLEDTPAIVQSLLEAGLSTRGGGGNTVRNISACPGTGFCGESVFDVVPYAVALTEYMVSDDRSFNLPRKFKIAFSGCEKDCSFASVADLGFFATIKDGRPGFAVYGGGGLGPSPSLAVMLQEFVSADEIFHVALAARNLFDAFGDRTNRSKARLRYVLQRLGVAEFQRLYMQQREALPAKLAELAQLPPEHAEQGEPLDAVRLDLKLGDISAEDLIAVAALADRYGDAALQTTQSQDLIIRGVPSANRQSLARELEPLAVDISHDRPSLTACTGSATCKLGLCLSRNLATEIDKALDGIAGADLKIRISGCPNSCGGHLIADIGLQGKARRIDGRLMPFYEVFVGGKTGPGRAALARSVGSVPARLAPALVAELVAEGTDDLENAFRLVHKYAAMPPAEKFYYDWGAGEPFSLAGRGPGECGAGVIDVILLDIDESDEAIKQSQKAASSDEKNKAIYIAAIAAARARLVTFGLQSETDAETLRAFRENLLDPAWVTPDVEPLISDAEKVASRQHANLGGRLDMAEKLLADVRRLFASLGADLKFRAEPYARTAKETEPQPQPSAAKRLDLRGVACPLNFVKAKLALETVAPGETLEILLDDGEPIRNVPASFADQGHEILANVPVEDHHCLTVRRSH